MLSLSEMTNLHDVVNCLRLLGKPQIVDSANREMVILAENATVDDMHCFAEELATQFDSYSSFARQTMTPVDQLEGRDIDLSLIVDVWPGMMHHQLAEQMFRCESLRSQEDAAWLSLLIAQTQKQSVCSELELNLILRLCRSITLDTIPVANMVFSGNLWPQLMSDTSFQSVMDVESRYDNVLGGKIARCFGVQVLTDAFEPPVKRIDPNHVIMLGSNYGQYRVSEPLHVLKAEHNPKTNGITFTLVRKVRMQIIDPKAVALARVQDAQSVKEPSIRGQTEHVTYFDDLGFVDSSINDTVHVKICLISNILLASPELASSTAPGLIDLASDPEIAYQQILDHYDQGNVNCCVFAFNSYGALLPHVLSAASARSRDEFRAQLRTWVDGVHAYLELFECWTRQLLAPLKQEIDYQRTQRHLTKERAAQLLEERNAARAQLKAVENALLEFNDNDDHYVVTRIVEYLRRLGYPDFARGASKLDN
jgi:hypothetical protein